MLITAFACQSPMDVNTPRKIIEYPKGDNIKPVLGDVTFEENGVSKNFQVSDVYMEVDTNGTYPIVWLKLKVQTDNDISNETERIGVKEFEIVVDSVKFTNSSFTFPSDINSSFAKYFLYRCSDTSYDTTSYAGQNRNSTELLFTFNEKKKQIVTQLYSKIYDDKLKITKHDTTYIDPETLEPITITLTEINRLKDSLIIIGKFNFSY